MNTAYFVKEDIDSITIYTGTQIVQMTDILIDNIFVECGGHIFQQTVGIPNWYKLFKYFMVVIMNLLPPTRHL